MLNVERITLRGALAALLLSPVLVYGQFSPTSPSNFVDVTTTQNINAQPAGTNFSVTVTTPLGTSLADVVALISSAGVTASNLVSVTSNSSASSTTTSTTPTLSWTFQLSTTFTNQATTSASLATLQSTIGANGLGETLTYNLTSSNAQPVLCDYGSLVQQADSQAQILGAATTQALGGIIGLATTVTPTGPSCTLEVKYSLGSELYQSTPSYVAVMLTQPSSGVTDDTAAIEVGVTSPTSTALSTITTALQTAGLTGLNFEGVNTIYVGTGTTTPSLGWMFIVTTPLTNLGTLLTQLSTTSGTFPTNNTGLSLSYKVLASYASQPASCPLPGLLTAAQNQAQLVTSGANRHTGNVISLSVNATAPQIPSFGYDTSLFNASTSPTTGTTTGTTTTGTTTTTTSTTGTNNYTPSACVLTAVFQLN